MSIEPTPIGVENVERIGQIAESEEMTVFRPQDENMMAEETGTTEIPHQKKEMEHSHVPDFFGQSDNGQSFYIVIIYFPFVGDENGTKGLLKPQRMGCALSFHKQIKKGETEINMLYPSGGNGMEIFVPMNDIVPLDTMRIISFIKNRSTQIKTDLFGMVADVDERGITCILKINRNEIPVLSDGAKEFLAHYICRAEDKNSKLLKKYKELWKIWTEQNRINRSRKGNKK